MQYVIRKKSMNMHTLQEKQGPRLLWQLLMYGKRIFTMEDAIEAATVQKIPHNQLKKILSNLSKRAQVLRLRRGLYICIGILPEQAPPHPFVIAIHLVQPSAISHWSALQYHGLTEQIPQIITASTTNKVVTPSMREASQAQGKAKHFLMVNNVRYKYITVQKKHFFGHEKIWIAEDLQVPITDKERTLLDVFIYPKMFGGMGEALGILENALSTIDIKKLIHYAIEYDKKSIVKRLGWVLQYFGVPLQQLEELIKVKMNYYCRLDPSLPSTGPYDKNWMIQNNLTKLEKQ